MLDVLLDTEALLRKHPQWADMDPGHSLTDKSKFHRLPSQFNLVNCRFRSLCAAAKLARIVCNAFYPISGDITTVYALLRQKMEMDKIREYMLQSGVLRPHWIDYFFSTPVFDPTELRTGMALYMMSLGKVGERNLVIVPHAYIRAICRMGIPLQVWWPEDKLLFEVATKGMARWLAPTEEEYACAQ
jgi:hypothetical protein